MNANSSNAPHGFGGPVPRECKAQAGAKSVGTPDASGPADAPGTSAHEPASSRSARRRNIRRDLLVLAAIVVVAFGSSGVYSHWHTRRYYQNASQRSLEGDLQHWAEKVQRVVRMGGAVPNTLTAPAVGAARHNLRGTSGEILDSVHDIGNGNYVILAKPTQKLTGWGACVFRLDTRELHTVWFDGHDRPAVHTPEEVLAALRAP